MGTDHRPALFLVTPQFGDGRGGLGVSAARVARALAGPFRLAVFEATPELPQLACEAARDEAPWERLRVSLAGDRRQARQFLSDVVLARAREARPALLAAFYAGELAHPVWLTARLLGCPTVLFARGNDVDLEPFGDGGPAILRALEAAARVYCVTRELASKVERWAPTARVRYVPNAVDGAEFPYAAPPPPSERPLVGLFGDLKAKKGLDLLLGHLDFSRFRLRIVGDLRPDAEKRLHGFFALHPERTRDLRHVPYVEDRALLRRHYAEVDLVCVPSLHEGMSNVMLEAMSTGRPCVCSRVGGAVDVITDGEDGFLFDALSGESFADAMARAGDALRRDAAGLGLRARRTVEERHPPAREREAYLADLLTLLPP
jgi:glycosyltransferase involved in cell wall biosynthesis